jgi:beta-glucosidase
MVPPRVVMVMIGANNMDINTTEEIAAGVTAICEELHVRLPQSKILLIGIFPRGAKADAGRDKILGVNMELAKLHGRAQHHLPGHRQGVPGGRREHCLGDYE